MDVFIMTEEFNWVKKVLFSSQTTKHMKCCDYLFDNFLNKWRFDMTEDLKITLSNDFRVNYEEQSEKIEKNGVIM
jgi:ribosome-associated toxin RatA of RatAB toxin-antitoxin module